MSMKKLKFRKRTALYLSLALSLLLLIAVVGDTIHILHKKAYALVSWRVYFYEGDPENFVNGLDVELRYEEEPGIWSNWGFMFDQQNGTYTIGVPDLDEWVPWQVRFDDQEFGPINPPDMPANGPASFVLDWEVAEIG